MPVAILIAAMAVGAPKCDSKYPPDHESFLNLRYDQRARALADYELEKQVDLYVAALLETHPPQLELADVVAANGARVLPFLIRRIQKEEFEGTQVDLLYVVLRMQEMRKADIAGEENTMRALETVVSSMRDSGWKRKASEFLRRIRAG